MGTVIENVTPASFQSAVGSMPAAASLSAPAVSALAPAPPSPAAAAAAAQPEQAAEPVQRPSRYRHEWLQMQQCIEVGRKTVYMPCKSQRCMQETP